MANGQDGLATECPASMQDSRIVTRRCGGADDGEVVSEVVSRHCCLLCAANHRGVVDCKNSSMRTATVFSSRHCQSYANTFSFPGVRFATFGCNAVEYRPNERFCFSPYLAHTESLWCPRV